jgi:hypothetical protein
VINKIKLPTRLNNCNNLVLGEIEHSYSPSTKATAKGVEAIQIGRMQPKNTFSNIAVRIREKPILFSGIGVGIALR